jgi:hypothetical protein
MRFLNTIFFAAFATTIVAFAQNPVTSDAPFQIKYFSNLTAGDAYINIVNDGYLGANLNGPGIGTPVGNMCINVYTFSSDEQLASCCSCLVTPNALVSLSVQNDLIANTVTGVKPGSVVVKLLASVASSAQTAVSCIRSAAEVNNPVGTDLPTPGLLAWGTTVHPAVGGGYATTETAFTPATLSAGEEASIVYRCLNIIGNGSTFGICSSCRAGGLGATRH